MKSLEIQLGGAVTVINGMGLGIGSAMGTNICHSIKLEEAEKLEFSTSPKSDTKLLQECVNLFSSKYNISIDDIKIATELSYSGAKGMKTSSVVATGVISLLSQYYDIDIIEKEIINLGADAAIAAGVSVTGAIDDAYATYFGDFWVTQNLGRKVLAHHSLDLNKTVIFIHPEKSNIKTDIDFELEYLDKYILKQAIDEAKNGDWKSAIEKNSRVYAQFLLDEWDIINSIEDVTTGTTGLNGAGPSLFLICNQSEKEANLEILKSNFQQFSYTTSSLR